MKKFRIKYNTMFEINKTIELAAENEKDALFLFNMNFHEALDIVSIEEVQNETVSTPN